MVHTYRLPLKQHIGAADKPTVTVGEKVKRGALIAHAEKLGANIHASVNGKITAVTDAFIEIEGEAPTSDEYKRIADGGNIAAKVKAAGVVGMGGAGFPTHVKLATDLAGGTIIANGVECEPLLSHNIRQIIDQPATIYRGIKYAMESTHASRGILAIKSKNQAAINAFRQVIDPRDNITIHELPDLYPMGEERAIIRETLGVLLRVDQLPVTAGAVILNVETLSCITDAVEALRPVITKNVTVVGKIGSGHEPQVFMNVPIGTPVHELLARADGIDGNYGEIIMGGPFTGKAVELDDVVTKTTGGIIVTMEFPHEKRPLGLLVCACGGNEDRLRDIAAKMEADVVAVRKCKQAVAVNGALKCENPGNCPGQAEKILELKKSGAQALLVSNCSDCTNTVMCVAPKLKMPVYHATDHIMRTIGHALVRRLPLQA
ncbi:MAG: proline reductase-associated electron transfer protein PrdC [Solidesulfovibrio sp.]